ncbi:hypothetical protein KIN20_015778 [Parelaphostrongylus tenuis]|uniref:Uncharacterized protein n=1 Tax=Parelaphostrongylus tenuis TaxID=148309 RepID=A0AAD5MFG7_PARTN|nr:hypothetical protein KIN20_015778 [Parelaphostrongylus tenuis]
MLAKAVAALRREPAIPSTFPDHVFSIYQRYLSACGVAYTTKDYTENVEEMFRALVCDQISTFERAQEKKKKAEGRKERGKEALETSTDAWVLLMSDTLGENLDMQSDDDHQEEFESKVLPASTSDGTKSHSVDVVDTMVPKETIDHAATLYLALDVLVALVYVSLVTIGCRWILLSDLIRWVREGRFGISIFQLGALSSYKLEKSRSVEASYSTKMDLPLYEFQRIMLFIWQLCRLPPTPAKVDFEQIVARILYNLNLPRAMMGRVQLLLEKVPPCVELDEKSLRRQGCIEHGPYVNGCSSNSEERFSVSQIVNVFGRLKQTTNALNTDIFYSTETKAFAYILMALKLCFGLDGEREFDVKGNTGGFSSNIFSIMQWLYQLKMRIMFWEGYDPLDILQTYKPVGPLLYEENLTRSHVSRFGRDKHSTDDSIAYTLIYTSRDFGFTHCIPSSMNIDSSASIPNPFPEYTCGEHNYGNDDESLYAPLRRQLNVLRAFLTRPLTAEEKDEIRTALDEIAVRTFKADFEKHILFDEASSTNTCKADLTKGRAASDGSRAETWHRYFPCAKGYVRYPRPNFTNSGLLTLKEKSYDLLMLNRRMGLGSKTSGLRMVFASRKAAIDAWECAQSAMSHTFSMLLHWFSKIIGESEHVLYSAFLMLEYQLVDFKKFHKLRRALLDGSVYPMKSSTVDKDGRREFNTLFISAAEDISDTSEVDIVRIGLPKHWGTSSGNGLENPIRNEDNSSPEYSDDDFGVSDSSGDEAALGTRPPKSKYCPKRTGLYFTFVYISWIFSVRQ